MKRARTWATVKDLAVMYKMHPNTVRAKVRSGAWPAERIGDGPRPMIRFTPEQQDQIDALNRSGRSHKSLDWLDAALGKLSA